MSAGVEQELSIEMEKGIQLLDAITDGDQITALQLIKEGADLTVQRKGDNAIHLAAQKGNIDIIKKLRGVDRELPNILGETPAHFAAIGGYVHVVKYLKGKGVNLNRANEYGHTPLHEAVMQQPMDILESFIALGMDPNALNLRTGQTPAHVAAAYGRRMAIEALVLSGGKLNARDLCGRKPEDVARDEHFRHIVRMYDAMETAFGICAIPAAGMKVTNSSAMQVTKIDRVGIIVERLDNIDVPAHSPASFYCRRENPESASVPLKQFEDEHVYSDLFFILVSNVADGCPARILLPLHAAPSSKEELVLRFISSGEMDRTVDETVTIDEMAYCPVKTVLIQEVTCICLLYTRPRQEEFQVPTQGAFIETQQEPHFSIDVPPGAFEDDNKIELKIFDTQSLNDTSKRKRDWGMKRQSCPFMTSVFEIKLLGSQPRKAVTLQLPVTGDVYGVSDIVVMRLGEDAEHIDETKDILHTLILTVNHFSLCSQPRKAVTLQLPVTGDVYGVSDIVVMRLGEDAEHIDETKDILPVKPKFINNTLIFTVNHFSTYVAIPKDKICTKKDAQILERQLSFARERRKPGTFFAAFKHLECHSFIMLIDFGLASKSRERHRKWKEQGFEPKRPMESEAFMVVPGDWYFIDIKGNASFEDPADGRERKFCFSSCRVSCHQTFLIQAHDLDHLDNYLADIVIFKEVQDERRGNYDREVCRLGVSLMTSRMNLMTSRGRRTPQQHVSRSGSVSRQGHKATPRSHGNQPQQSQNATPRTARSMDKPLNYLGQRKLSTIDMRDKRKGDTVSGKQSGPCQGTAYLESHFLKAQGKSNLM